MSFLVRRAVIGAFDRQLDVSDMFSVSLWTGNGSARDIPNVSNPDVEDILVWTKSRSEALSHRLFDSVRGAGLTISSDNTSSELSAPLSLSSFNDGSFTLGVDNITNIAGGEFTAWSFRKAPKFFNVIKYTGDGVAGREIPHGLGAQAGMCIVRLLSSVTSCVVQHVHTTGSDFLRLDGNDAARPFGTMWNNTTMTDEVVTLGFDGSVNANVSGHEEYVMYVFAHDPSSEGAIQCGEFNGADANKVINLGWAENAQYVMIKPYDAVGDWEVYDSTRGNDNKLSPNTASVEVATSRIFFDSNGFRFNFSDSKKYIYMAIRAE